MSTQFTNRQWRLPNEENKSKVSNYSMDFDGSSDYIKTSTVAMTDNKSLSMWFKTTNVSTTQGIFESQPVGGTSDYLVVWLYQSKIMTSSSGSASATKKSSVLNSNTWYHLVITKSSGQIDKIYINGQDDTQTSTSYLAYINGRNFNYIGATYQGTGYDNEFLGQIDAVSIYNYALSQSQITTLYGSSSTGIGNPMSLSPKPVAYYPLGDQDAFNGANYLVPNIAAEEADGDIAVSYSPYALDFDSASSDYIDFNSIDLGTTNTISFWHKRGNTTANQNILGSLDGTQKHIVYFTAGYIYIRPDGSTQFITAYLANTPYPFPPYKNTTDWANYIITRSGDNIKLYLNGVEFALSGSGIGMAATTVNRIGTKGNSVTGTIDGELSNVSFWNTALTSTQVTEIYSEGIPQNLNNHSAVSSLVSWWQLGSNSSFNTNWTVLDEVTTSGNNGTSVNMTEASIVDGVGSYANGLSSGMGGDEVIGDAPYSTANALSVNMDVEDRDTDTPS